MPRSPKITTSRLGVQRRLVADIVQLAGEVPSFPVERVIDLSAVDRCRGDGKLRIGWAAIFTKAYALVAREMPVLRTWYVPGFWPRQAMSPFSVASLSINRSDDSGDTLYWARLRAPEDATLASLQAEIRRHVNSPVAEVFRRQLQLASLPGWLRRRVLRWNLRSTSAKRPLRLGTFSVSSLSGEGAFNRMHPSPLTTSLAYCPLDAAGRSTVTLLADHRLIDGVPAARALTRLEAVLQGPILAELQAQRGGWRSLLGRMLPAA